MTELRTKRLLLRPWRTEDLPAWVAMNADPAVREHFRQVLTPEQSAAEMAANQRTLRRNGYGRLAVELLTNGEFIGCAGLVPLSDDAPLTGVEVSLRIARPAWRRGYGSEATWALIAFGFKQLALPEIIATATADNPSHYLLDQLGMVRDPASDYCLPGVGDGPPLHLNVYRLTAEQWRSGLVICASPVPSC